jgi:hypothetical protein
MLVLLIVFKQPAICTRRAKNIFCQEDMTSWLCHRHVSGKGHGWTCIPPDQIEFVEGSADGEDLNPQPAYNQPMLAGVASLRGKKPKIDVELPFERRLAQHTKQVHVGVGADESFEYNPAVDQTDEDFDAKIDHNFKVLRPIMRDMARLLLHGHFQNLYIPVELLEFFEKDF